MVDQVDKSAQNVLNALETKCGKHNRWNYIYVHIQQDQNNPLKCQDCIIEEHLSTENLIQLYKITESGQDTIFQNWPPLISDKKNEIQEGIQQVVDKSNGLGHMQEQLEHFFTEFKTQVNEKLQAAFKKLSSKMNEVFSSESQILHIYNEISEKAHFQEIINTFQENPEEKLKQLQKMITEKLSQQTTNTELFQNALCEFQLNRPIFSLDIPTQIKNQILTLIDSIEVYEIPLSATFDLNQSINRRSECIQVQKTLEDKTKILMNLISNKSNFCSAEFLSQIEETLKNFKIIFKNIQFDNIYIDNCYPVDFSQISQSQIQDLSLLKDIIYQTQQKYTNQQQPHNQLSKEIQPISYQILQFIQKNPSFSQVYQQQFETVLKKYPIFDGIIEDPMQVISLKFELAERDGKQHAQLIQNEFKSWVFQINSNTYCQAFIPFTIDNSLKYIARLKCQTTQRQDHIWVGLIPESERDTLLLYEQSLISFRFCSKSYNKVKEVIKGKPLFNQQKIEELEIHFCIKDKYFACADFPQYENINKVSAEYANLFDLNKLYNLAFLMYHQNSRIQLTFFQVVEEFPVL